MHRPVVLISAVSGELQSARYVAANSLATLGLETIWQDTAPTETSDLKAAIRDQVDQAHAVLQIVGHHLENLLEHRGGLLKVVRVRDRFAHGLSY